MKVLYVATVTKTHIMEFHIPFLKKMKELGWQTSVASRNDYDNPYDCNVPYCDEYYDVPFERNPVHIGNIKAFLYLKKIITSGHYDIIHCHTPVGAALTRLASGKARKNGSKVIYTAHGFHFYKGAPIINWLLYYTVEKLLGRKADVIITINREDYERAKKFRTKRVEFIEGVGVDLQRFCAKPEEKKNNRKKICAEYDIEKGSKILLSVGEVNSNKNHKEVIGILNSLGDNYHYIICGSGPLIQKLGDYAKQLGVGERVHFAGYRNDVYRFYQSADVFVFPSKREGLPVSLMEAMASGIPCVATDIRGNSDLLSNSLLLYPIGNKEALKKAIKDSFLEEVRINEVKRNNEVLKKYESSQVVEKTIKLYKDVLSC